MHLAFRSKQRIRKIKFVAALRKELSLPQLKLHIESDSSFSLHTAYPDKESGMLLIAGTGSVAMAKKRNGEIVKVGGFRSSSWRRRQRILIGLQALKYYSNVLQETEDKGKLFLRIKDALADSGIDSGAIRNKLYQNEICRRVLLRRFRFPPRRLLCKNILYDAACHLMEGVEILSEKVGNKCEPVLTLHGKVGPQGTHGS